MHPDCANGSFTYETGEVLLTGLVPYDGGMAYHNITLVPPAGTQPTMGDRINGMVP